MAKKPNQYHLDLFDFACGEGEGCVAAGPDHGVQLHQRPVHRLNVPGFSALDFADFWCQYSLNFLLICSIF